MIMRTSKDRFKKPFIFQTIVLLLFIGLFVFFAIRTHLATYPNTYDKTKVDFVGLNDQEQQDVSSLTNRIKSTYEKFVKSIVVVKSIKDYCSKNPSVACYDCLNSQCLGFNYYQQVVVEYRVGPKMMEEILCHEIAHSIVYHNDPSDENLHQVVYDLGSNDVCFEPEISMSPAKGSWFVVVFVGVLGTIVILFLLREVWLESLNVLRKS
jgi:hypothetical protein